MQHTWLAVMDFTWLVVLIWILAWLAVKIRLFINWMQLHSCELDAWYKLVLSVQQFWTFWSHSVNLCEYSTILLFMSIVQEQGTAQAIHMQKSSVDTISRGISARENRSWRTLRHIRGPLSWKTLKQKLLSLSCDQEDWRDNHWWSEVMKILGFKRLHALFKQRSRSPGKSP